MDNNRLDIGLIQKIYIFTKFPIMPSKLVDFLLFWYMIYFKKISENIVLRRMLLYQWKSMAT